METVIAIGAFALLLAALLIAYERPARNKKKITGRGGDFE
jgi:hypothetical protein